MDQIDHQILKLLQQRTKISRQIGLAKKRHQAPIYVPERERELLERVARRSDGKIPARAVTAIYREILSCSRAAQGQAPVGMLESSASRVISPGRWSFGACDDFQLFPTWAEIALSLEKGTLAAALITGEDLARSLKKPSERHQFLARLTVVSDLFPGTSRAPSLAQRIFIVTPRAKGAAGEAHHVLILIECKSTSDAVDSLVNTMPDRPQSAEQLVLRSGSARRPSTSALGLLAFPQALDGIRLTGEVVTTCKSLGFEVSILGVYPATETYGG